MKNYLNKKSITRYLLTELTGNFAGFLIGMSATGLVSKFFETRSIRNLWGLTTKKTVIDKTTFTALEWIISIIVGFLVFEIFTKVIAGWVKKNSPRYKYSFMRRIVQHNLHHRCRAWLVKMDKGRVALFAVVNQSLARRNFRK